MHERDVRDHHRAPRDSQPRQLERLGRQACGEREGGPQAHRLLDHRVDVLVIAAERGAFEPREHVWKATDALEHPGQGGCGGVVAAEQKSPHRIADLLVAHQAALLVGSAQKHPEDVFAIEPFLAAALGDLLDHDRIDGGDRAADPREGPLPPVLAAGGDHRFDEEAPRVALAKQPERRRTQPLDPGGFGDSEHRRHHHLEGDPLDMRPGGGGATVGPARKRLFGLALHRLVVAGERAAVERRQLLSPHAHVLGAVEVRQPRRAEDEVMSRGLRQGSPEAKHVGVGGEHPLDVLGVGQAQPRPGGRGHRNDEAIAEALAAARKPLRGEPVLSGVCDCGASQSGQVGERFVHDLFLVTL